MLSFGEKNKRSSLSHNNTLTNAKKETLLTHQIALLFWMNSCSYFEANPAFIQRVFFQKRTVMLARGESSGFVFGRRLEHAAHVVICI